MSNLRSIVCIICHSVFLEQHPEYKYREIYLKCSICGFTKEVEKKSNERDRTKKE